MDLSNNAVDSARHDTSPDVGSNKTYSRMILDGI